MVKFRVGDIVIANEKASMNYTCIKAGDKGIVTDIDDSCFDFLLDDGGKFIGLSYDCFDLISFTKNDLQDGDIVTLRNGDRLIHSNHCFHDLSECHNHLFDLNDIDDVLYSKICDDDNIIKITRPTEYVEIFLRKEEPKKMTVSQICEALGYDVEIIKEGE